MDLLEKSGRAIKTVFARKPLLLSFCIVVAGALVFMSGISFLNIIELKTIDMRFKLRGDIPPGDRVVLAAIDEKSLKQEGRWVWPRTKIAALVDKLSEKGARVIAFDVGFFEPESSEVVRTIGRIQAASKDNALRNKRFDDYLATLKNQSDNDRILVEAIKRSRATVVLGFFFQMNPEDALHITEAEIETHTRQIAGGRYTIERFSSDRAREAWLYRVAAPQSNIQAISEAASYAGYFNKLADPDGVVRRMTMVMQFNNTLYAPLSLKAAGAYLEEPLSITVEEDYGVASLMLGDLSIPVDERGDLLINYRGPEKTFPHIPVTDILNDTVDEGLIRDKIVLVGATAIGIHDECVTPVAKVFPGPEVHLNVIDSILSEDFLFHPAWAALFDLLVIIGGGMLLAYVLLKTSALPGGLAMAAMFGGYLWLCQFFFTHMGWILNMVYPLCVFLAIYVFVTSYKYLSEEGQKKFIREAFSKYLAPEVVNQLISSPQKLVLGGERREITAFFSDVQGFTGISEKLAPEELVDLLNDFLTEITDIILQYKGAVDKFEGDAVIAFFGAPNELPNHPEAACLACIDIQKRMVELRAKWRGQGKPELKVRIGLYSGPAVVGNMGSRNRMDYTMMGDTVNTAARLEGVNKIYGTYTMAGQPTYEAAADALFARELDAVTVVGKKKPVAIYEILGRRGEVDETVVKTTEAYAKGLTAYRQRRWDQAVTWFKEALAVTPDDGPSLTMIRRCEAYAENPPPEDWNGAFSMMTK
ncbi:MAG: adenylate/guanylate cyclase domain-containing protein [Thermodesulfobacteriota bacterium]|nr:adenylate/guanylate cyclase domain-containing protein [Thermodesulfobacteriota bacterium]